MSNTCQVSQKMAICLHLDTSSKAKLVSCNNSVGTLLRHGGLPRCPAPRKGRAKGVRACTWMGFTHGAALSEGLTSATPLTPNLRGGWSGFRAFRARARACSAWKVLATSKLASTARGRHGRRNGPPPSTEFTGTRCKGRTHTHTDSQGAPLRYTALRIKDPGAIEGSNPSSSVRVQ